MSGMLRAYLAIVFRDAIRSSGTVQTVTALVTAALVAAVVFKLLPIDDAAIRTAQDVSLLVAGSAFLADMLFVLPYHAWLAERRKVLDLDSRLSDLRENPPGPIGIQVIDSDIGAIRRNKVTRIGASPRKHKR